MCSQTALITIVVVWRRVTIYPPAGVLLSQMGHALLVVGFLRSCMDAEVKQLDELMQRYARGDDNAFEALYQLLAPRLYRFCMRLSAHRSDADDLLQDTFLRLHRARATYLPGAVTLHWAFAIARSASLDRHRYRRRRPETTGAASDVAEDGVLSAHDAYRPEAELLANELRLLVTRELEKMSEKNRIAYILLREEGLMVKEAAAVLGTTADVVKQRAHRACEHLRRAVGAAGWKEQSHEAFWNPVRSLRV